MKLNKGLRHIVCLHLNSEDTTIWQMALATTSMGCIIHKWLLPKLQCLSSCGPPTLASHMLSHMDSRRRVMGLPAVRLTDTGWWPLEIEVYTMAHGRKTDNASPKMLPLPSWDWYLTSAACAWWNTCCVSIQRDSFTTAALLTAKNGLGKSGKIRNSLTCVHLVHEFKCYFITINVDFMLL